MSSAIDAIDRRAISVTRARRAAGTYNADGEFVPGAPTSIAILAVIQPARGAQLMDLPEGIRAEAGYVIWSRSDIALDDEVAAGSVRYRVMHLWPRPDGGFYRAAMGLLK